MNVLYRGPLNVVNSHRIYVFAIGLQIVFRQAVKMLVDDEIGQPLLSFGPDRKDAGKEAFGVGKFFFANLFVADTVKFVEKLFERIAGYGRADLGGRLKITSEFFAFEPRRLRRCSPFPRGDS